MREALGKGLTIRPIRTMMNHNSTEVFFDNMIVPAENLVGVEGRGFRYILDGMNAERLLIAAECIGDAKWFLKKASDYARERRVFGRPIGQNQGIQFPLARAYAQMRAAELMVQAGCAKFEAGLTPGEEANMAKMLAADASWAAGEACIQTHGGFGFIAEEYDVERKFRETRLYQVAPISTNLDSVVYRGTRVGIAEELLTVPATKAAMTGGCQCGAVRYALFEVPESTVCHCRMCQKAVGGPFAALSKVPMTQFSWTRGSPDKFQSSSAAERHFCAACGTPLTFHYLNGDAIEVTTGKVSICQPRVPGHQKNLAWGAACLGLTGSCLAGCPRCRRWSMPRAR